ncbi:hypothetical protein M2145_000301 [Lachnospiraceae bacterium PF1-21]|uniref:hypothetical protein n=1 Tax=Ohessyouella blattaphilus TaxID=2949333 RepID=UPI003E1AA88E
MEVWNYLYTGAKIGNKKHDILYQIRNRQESKSVYLLCLNGKLDNRLEIISYRETLGEHYPHEDLTVVGLAKDYEEAEDLLEEIATEVYLATKDVNISDFLLDRIKERR